MDYKEAYYSLIERLKEAKEDSDICDERYCCVIDGLIQEQEENEDEKIRKVLIGYFKSYREVGTCGAETFHGISTDNIIAWLEKQCKETSWKPSKEEMDVLYGLAYITNQYDEKKEEVITRLYQDLKREFFNGSSYENMFPDTEDCVRRRSTIQVLEYARSLDTYNQFGKADIDKNIAWLEKQGIKPQGKTALEAIHEQKADNANKVEPKFHVNEWVVTDKNNVVQIKAVNNGYYTIDNGMDFSMSYVDRYWHLWSIEDAKYGDVLATKAGGIFIYKELLYDKPFAYCGVDKFGVFKDCNCGKGLDWTPYLSDVTPATKEQRDILFQKMREKGYEWDADKKELKKIDNEEFNGEDYGIDSLYHAQRILEKTLGKVDGYQSDDGILEHECAITAVKKLYEQKPAEWSEDDEQIALSIGQVMNCAALLNIVPEKISRIRTWLQSLKQRVIWKPTVNEKSNTELAEPTPITPKILQKNGFELKPNGWLWCQDKGNEEQNYIFIQFRKDLDEVRLVEISFVRKIQATFRQINDVHELQSLLNICHIKKEIEL